METNLAPEETQNKEEEEYILNYNINKLVDEIVKEQILLKLQRNITYVVDGRIILFSNLIKKLCCNSQDFNYRLNLENLEREVLGIILQFIDIIEWKQEKYMFDVKMDELNNWFENNKKMMSQVEETCNFLKITKIFDFLRLREKLKSKVGTFKTALGLKIKSSHKLLKTFPQDIENLNKEELATKNFQEAFPPNFDPLKLSLNLPIDINAIKKNATKNFTQKGKFNPVLHDQNLNGLLDALIADSFWFVVCFFQISNVKEKRRIEDLKKQVNEILKRVSTNYFKFFINLCDDDSSIKKKDPVLNMFRDFMSQCVFYSLYLAFPKSRHIFDEEFRNRIISLFSYLYNGLNSQKNFSVNHWDLDLGKGNILENNKQMNKNESKIVLPEISDFHKIIKANLKNQEHTSKDKPETDFEKKNTAQTTILNTPLYRLYAENNRFETLNLIKPIKFSQRKVVDIEHKTKQDSDYLDKVKDYQKLMNKKKKSFNEFVTKNEKVFNDKMREVKQNTKRLKKEFQDIRIQRYQEYANYCIFISSK